MKSVKRKSFKQLLGHIKIQLLIFSVISAFLLTQLFWQLPSFDEMIRLLGIFFDEKGNYVVAVASFLENIIGINAYFPGSAVILSTMAITHGFPMKAVITFLFIYFPSILAHIINYYVGTLLKIKDDTPLKTNLWLWFFGTMWHPSFAAVTSTQCGSKNIPFSKFLFYYLPTGFLWYLFWGTLMYSLGSIGNVGSLFIYIFMIYLFVWTFVDVWRFYSKD